MSQKRRPPTGPGGYELSEKHRHVIQSNRVFLVNKLNPNTVINGLIEKKIIAPTDKDLVTRATYREEAVRNLLNMLTRRGPNALSALIESCVESGQYEVADKLSAEAPDIDVQRPASPVHSRRMETRWEPKSDYPLKQAMTMLKFPQIEDEVSLWFFPFNNCVQITAMRFFWLWSEFWFFDS